MYQKLFEATSKPGLSMVSSISNGLILPQAVALMQKGLVLENEFACIASVDGYALAGILNIYYCTDFEIVYCI
jgi:hypothetical protein